MLNGPALKKCRKDKLMTQADLARAVGITGARLSTWETGKNQPKPEMITALARALDVPVSKITTTIW